MTTFSQLWNAIRLAWRSRPFAIILPLAATAWYWWTHGHDIHSFKSFPNWQEFIAGAALLTTKWERVSEFFLGAPNANVAVTPKPPVAGLVLLLGLSLGLTSCKTTSVPDAGTVVTVAETCAAKATHEVALSIIGDVNTALAATVANWEGELATLAARWGMDAVRCAVAEVTNASSGKAMASHDALESLKAERGKAWLAAH